VCFEFCRRKDAIVWVILFDLEPFVVGLQLQTSDTPQRLCSVSGELRKVEVFAAGMIGKKTTTFVTMLFMAIRMRESPCTGEK
jgi:hypothetical protein